MNNIPEYWEKYDCISLEDFIKLMVEFGTPIETSIIGHFDDSDRGHRKNIKLPMHYDGEYSGNPDVDLVGIYCIKEGDDESNTFLQPDGNEKLSMWLRNGDSLIINNRTCKHGRGVPSKNRLLFRIWIKFPQ